MRTVRIATALVLGAAAAVAAGEACGGHGTRETMLVSTSWLSQHLADPNLVILEVGDPAAETHIPGSQFLDYMDTHYMKSPQGLTMELLPMPELAKNFEKYGVSNNSRIVLYWNAVSRVSYTTRVFLTLDAMGLGRQTSILDGGLPVWRSEGRKLTADLHKPAPGKLTPCPQNDVVTDAAYVRANIRHSGVHIVDARAPEYYDGSRHGNGQADGHIPGATNITFSTLVGEDGKFKSPDALARMFRDAGVNSGDRVVSYCHIGQQATVVYFVARYLGYDARLYDGSWEDWGSHSENPVEKGTH